MGWGLVHSGVHLTDSKEWRGTPCNERGAALKTHLQGCSELLGLDSGAHTAHPSSLATVNQASSKFDVVL